MKKMLIAVVGLLGLTAVAHADSSGTGFGTGQSLDVKGFLSEARASKAPDAPIALAASAAENPQASRPGQDVEWVTIDGGKFMMGDDKQSEARPVHEVAIKTFEMSKTLVTVEQYKSCVIAGRCSRPRTENNPTYTVTERRSFLGIRFNTYHEFARLGPYHDYCNWEKPGRERHPINCVTWSQAREYADFIDLRFPGARLPNEAEWEYAAKSGGKDQPYPWGNEAPSCKRAVYDDCADGTMPVCSTPAGNTAQGLCDMAGNVKQYMQDRYQSSYADAPTDGSALEMNNYSGANRVVVRGGRYHYRHENLRADSRNSELPDQKPSGVGFRLARDNR